MASLGQKQLQELGQPKSRGVNSVTYELSKFVLLTKLTKVLLIFLADRFSLLFRKMEHETNLFRQVGQLIITA